jgi:hypothetical protein
MLKFRLISYILYLTSACQGTLSDKDLLVNKSQCYLYHAIIFKSREIGVKIGLSELFGVLGLFVGFGDWRQTARNAFTIGL